MVMSGSLSRDDAKPAAEAAGGCLKLLGTGRTPPITDIARRGRRVRFVPQADIRAG